MKPCEEVCHHCFDFAGCELKVRQKGQQRERMNVSGGAIKS